MLGFVPGPTPTGSGADAARNQPRSRESAPTITCASNRAALVHPSPQILDARKHERSAWTTPRLQHLHELARADDRPGHADAERIPQRRRARWWINFGVPALVVGRVPDCLASNALARALSPNFTPGRNLLKRQLFSGRPRRTWSPPPIGTTPPRVWSVSPAGRRRLQKPIRVCDAIVDELRKQSQIDLAPRGGSHRCRLPGLQAPAICAIPQWSVNCT